MKGMPFLYKRDTFFAEMVYKRVRGWTLGGSLPVLNFVEYPLPRLLNEGAGNTLKFDTQDKKRIKAFKIYSINTRLSIECSDTKTTF